MSTSDSLSSPQPIAVGDSNQFDVLSSPIDEGKSRDGTMKSRSSKDDIKENMYQAKEGVKTKALNLKEQVTKSGNDAMSSLQSQLPTVANLKEQVTKKGNDAMASLQSQLPTVASIQSSIQPTIDMVKQKVGVSKSASLEETAAAAQDEAEEEWEDVKRKGNKQLKKVNQQIDSKLNENLTADQRQQLNKGMKQAKNGAMQLERRAEGWSARLVSSTMSAPQLRPVKSFILRNNLSLPAVILGSFLTLWLGLTLIRMITSVATPSVPEFDIHSKENSMNWLKYHAGEYKNQAIDMRSSLSGRAAAFLANHEWDKLKQNAVNYREIGMNKLGLTEPTWGEWAWAKITGRPITWQERVESVLSLAKNGIDRVDLTSAGLLDRVKNMVRTPTPEPTLGDKVKNLIRTPTPEPSIIDNVKHTLQDGVDAIRSKLPGGEPIEVIRQRAYDATHPSTIDQIKSGANYIKNRVIHGAEEAAHIAQDRANEVADKAKYKAGL